MERMKAQSVKYGTRVISEDVAGVDMPASPFTVRGSSETVACQALIIAPGATATRMGVPSEERLWGRGISACATCDGALPVFRNQKILVIGGGDTAVEEALHLARFASRVYLAHRRDKLRASLIMGKRAMENPKIEILWNTVLVDVKGDRKVEGAVLKDVKSGATREMAFAGVFYAVGHTPNTAFLGGQVALDDTGYIVTKNGSTETSVAGVFACGDVQDKKYRQAVTAAGSGCMAALDAQRYLESRGA
jgi:thioredoxin reductase (NADPH)